MRLRKPLARTSFFLFLLICLLSGLAGVLRAPVNAATVHQIAPVCGLMMAGWTFDEAGLSTTNPAPTPSLTNVIASASANGVGNVGFTATGSHSGSAWSGNGWSQTGTPSSFFEFNVNTVGYMGVSISFWHSRSDTGPLSVSVQYSADGSTFTEFNTYTINTSVTQTSIGLSSITSLDNNPDVKIRIYGINATGAGGTLRIDDVIFTGCSLVSIDGIVPNPTNSGTTLTWHSAVNGTYEVRVGGTSCNDGTVIAAGSYTTSPGIVSSPVSAIDLVEGTNSVRVCLTDATATHSASSDITKDTLSPSILSFVRQSPTSAITNSDTLTFRVTFSEAVINVDNSDFVATGTTATPTSVNPISASVYDVTISGGDLPSLNGTVGLNLAASPPKNITDLASNSLPAGEPPVDETYTVDNTTVPPTSVVISEFRTRGLSGPNDEYIELYNPTSAVVDISGWKINASNDTGTISTRATIPASTILRSGQYYLIANNTTNGYSGIVPVNLTYGQGITDAGGIALVKPDNITIVDQVGVGANSAYKEVDHVLLLPTSDQSYERKLGGPSDSCQDTNNNREDFLVNPSDPKNYASQLSRCGTLLPIPVLTTTTITADTPDPSLVNANVSVSVKVTGGSIIPSGQVNITGANSNCTITLNSSGTGSCSVRFTSTGTKTLTATYVGDQTHLASSDTESHQVSTTLRAPTPTRVPTLPPPPPLIAINEFVPRPGSDWNNDGVVNQGDEYIELLNHGVIPVNLSGYRLDDEANIGSNPFSLPSVTLQPGERIVFYGSQTGLLLSDGGDGVRLLRPNGQLMDAYNYFVVYYPDQAFCRLPDNGGADDWNENCFPTPGLKNSLSGSILRPPAREDASQPLCPIADTLPEEFVIAECAPFGNNIWNRLYWDRFGWYGEMPLLNVNVKWEVFAD